MCVCVRVRVRARVRMCVCVCVWVCGLGHWVHSEQGFRDCLWEMSSEGVCVCCVWGWVW